MLYIAVCALTLNFVCCCLCTVHQKPSIFVTCWYVYTNAGMIDVFWMSVGSSHCGGIPFPLCPRILQNLRVKNENMKGCRGEVLVESFPKKYRVYCTAAWAHS